jgi:hypothetical protein
VSVSNSGGDIENVIARVTSLSPNTQIVDGDVVVGSMAAGASTTPDDTFTLRQNRIYPFDAANLNWQITFDVVNHAPSAHAGLDQTVFVGATVALDGTGSTDTDGDQLSYRWSFVSAPEGSVPVLSDDTSVKPSFELYLPGTYRLQLVVNDGVADSAPDTVEITTQNSPPKANAGPDQTTFVGNVAQLNGSGADADNDPLTFTWSFSSVPAGSAAALSNPYVPDPSFYIDRPGSYTAELIVNDGTADSVPDQITVNTENSRPLANAGPDLSLISTAVFRAMPNSTH